MRRNYAIAGKVYRGSRDLISAIRDILGRYPTGTCLGLKDSDFMMQVLEMHPAADAKIGLGVQDIRVVMTPWKKKGFIIERIDGTKEDFSFMQCLGLKGFDDKLTSAFREEVVGQILLFKKMALRPGHSLCPVFETELTWDNCDVDHVAPITFQSLIDRFLESKGLTRRQIAVQSLGQIRKIKNRKIAEEWKKFHLENAVLRLISKKAHRSLPRLQEVE